MIDRKSPFDALQAFLDNNPDLPVGNDTPVPRPETTVRHPRLDIILERKGRAGKTATIVTGFTVDDDELSRLASAIKTKLGTGGSARGGEILIQGDRRNDVKRVLEQEGYKTRLI